MGNRLASLTVLHLAMTQLSRSGAADQCRGLHKQLEQRRISVLARGLLATYLMALGACILPPPLEIGEFDAGFSSPPVVEQVLPEDFATPGPPIVLALDDPRDLTLVVRDIDLEETIFVRFFVDYNRPSGSNLAFKADCSAPPSGEPLRNVVCATGTICVDTRPENDPHFLEAVVADHPFLETNETGEDQPQFRALPPGAVPTVTAWILSCEP